MDAFLWDKGKMTDLGTLGGTITAPFAINSRGQVVGQSNLPGDQGWHGFVWSHGKLTDLSLRGNVADANWISDGGDVVGFSNLPGDQVYHAFLWTQQQMTDLGTPPGHECAIAYGVNSRRQAVGPSYGTCDVVSRRSAFISENGGPMADLNSLIQPASDFHFYSAWFISERGEIVTSGRLPNGELHVVFLVPDGNGGNDCQQTLSFKQSNVTFGSPSSGAEWSHSRQTVQVPIDLSDTAL